MRRDQRTSPLPPEFPDRQDIMWAYPQGRHITALDQRTSPLPPEPPDRQDIMWAYPQGTDTTARERTSALFPDALPRDIRTFLAARAILPPGGTSCGQDDADGTGP